MSAQALSLFGDNVAPPRPTRAPRLEVPIATPDAMARKREVMVLYTCASRATLSSQTLGGGNPVDALRRILSELLLSPSEVAVEARPETPNDVEIRDESAKDRPRHIVALAFEGLNIAEARAALAVLRNPTTPSSPKGRRR